jgi:hypothetical protein
MKLEQLLQDAVHTIISRAPGRAREGSKLLKAIEQDINYSGLTKRLGILLDNARNDAEFGREDLLLVGEALAALDTHHQAIRAGRPGPDKMYTSTMSIRLTDDERDTLGSIAKQTGESHSDVVRRLIRTAGS